MCHFKVFTFLCGGQKLQITTPCEHFATNYQGIQFCRLDPQAHVKDGVQRVYDLPTYGPGICSNINCRDSYGMLPYELSTKNNACDQIEDDSELDMSPEACAEREDRWFRLLSADQQLEALSTTFPIPFDSMTRYAKTYLYYGPLSATSPPPDFDFAWNDNPDEVTWQELNPRYMCQSALQSTMALHLLPSFVVDTKQPIPDPSTRTKKSKGKKAPSQIRTTTPHMPLFGPFKVPSHTCSPRVGFCKTCGHYHGKAHRRKPFVFHQADYALGQEMLAQEDPAVRAAMREAALASLPHERPVPSPSFPGGDQLFSFPQEDMALDGLVGNIDDQQVPDSALALDFPPFEYGMQDALTPAGAGQQVDFVHCADPQALVSRQEANGPVDPSIGGDSMGMAVFGEGDANDFDALMGNMPLDFGGEIDIAVECMDTMMG